MNAVDRAHFVLDKLDAYEDSPQFRIYLGSFVVLYSAIALPSVTIAHRTLYSIYLCALIQVYWLWSHDQRASYGEFYSTYALQYGVFISWTTACICL